MLDGSHSGRAMRANCRRWLRWIILAPALLASFAVVVSTASAQSIDIAGSWSCCGSSSFANAQKFDITDNNGTLGGKASDAQGVFATISGSVSGDSVRIVTTYTPCRCYVVTFVGTINAANTGMSGTLSSPNGSGSWTATRIGGGGGAPPGSSATTITKAKITGKKGKASFSFTGTRSPKGFQCKLIKPKKKHHKEPKATFSSCSSPKTYKHLTPGGYTFKVRASNAAGVGAAATKQFTIKH
jgi:hypothetical protein